MSVKTGTIPLFSANKINPIKICPLNTSSSSLYDAFLTLCKCIPIPFFQTERSFQGEFLLGEWIAFAFSNTYLFAFANTNKQIHCEMSIQSLF